MRSAFTVRKLPKAARRVLATLAAVCFFLPLGQCTQIASDPARPETLISGTHKFVPAQEIELPPKNMERLGFDLLLLVPFVWPLLLVMFSSRVKSAMGFRIQVGVEVVANALSLYLIGGIWLRVYSDIQPAGYIAIGTYLSYLALSLIEVGRMILSRISRTPSTAALP